VTEPPSYIGSAALNVVFNTAKPGATGPDVDFQILAKLVTVGIANSNQSVERSAVAATRYKGGTTLQTAGWLAAPQQSQKGIYSQQKYDSFAFSLPKLLEIYPSTPQLSFDIIARRRADPVTNTFNSDNLYRVLLVRVSTNRTFGLVSQALNVATGADYDYGGPQKDVYQKLFLGDGVQGVLIPAGQDVVLGRLVINTTNKTAVFTESIDITP
jgi:hypothetical protein